jgi:ABC-type phosphate/phosphonate transport system substrate-binding protein
MKKIGMILVIAVAITALLACSGRAAEKKSYTFGIRVGLSNQFDGQLKSIMTDIVKLLSKNIKIDVNMKWYLDDSEFISDLNKGNIDFAYTTSDDNTIKILNLKNNNEYLFMPFLRTTLFKRKYAKYCIYTNTNSNISNIGQLKGKNIINYSELFSYILLRIMLNGTNPEGYFKAVNVSPNGPSSFYSLALNEAPSAFVMDHNIDMLKIANPGPVKKIRELICSEELPFYPIYYRSSTPIEIVNEMISIFINIPQDNNINKYRPLLKMYGIRFIHTDRKDYDVIINIYKEAYKNGWDKDYERWIKYAKEEGK